jgi:hypothetical protein
VDKRLSREIAERRVMDLYGSTPADLMKIADSPVVKFMRITDSIMKRHPGLSRTEAMRKARLRNPRAFGRFQNV